MKKGLLLICFAIMAIFSVEAQVDIKSPHRDLNIKFIECVYSSGDVYFDLLITNLGKDTSIGINNTGTKAYDDLGNGYSFRTGTMKSGLANEELNVGSMTRTRMYVLPKDAPLRFRFKIENVVPDATKFTFISLDVNSRGFEVLDKEVVEIRNMVWQKK